MSESRRSNRVAISASPSVLLALEMTAERNGLPMATQAAMLIRQSLDRTMQSEAFRVRLQAERANWTTAQRIDAMSDEWEMETSYASVTKADAGAGG